MRALLPLTWLLLLAPPVDASHCETHHTNPATLDTGPGLPARYYVDVDHCDICGWTYIVVYEESNGIPGLQRGDKIVDDTCHAAIRPDTLILQ